MKVHTQPHGNVSVVVAHGPLVAEELIDLRRAMEKGVATGNRHVIVDLADVPYLDSSGIEMLLELCGSQNVLHQRPKLAAVSETCMEALGLTDVLSRLEVYDTVENALRSCRR
jgi:stage II sporulation protein AA (anti-sigma F factor antagonist)